VIISNALVWRFFVKGLHNNNESALVPTMISTAANFCLSGLFGFIIFNEKANSLWWLGLIMVLAGLYLIVSDKNLSEVRDENKND